MLKIRTDCRQAEEIAAPQQFNSPQVELAWLKENRRDLKGFVRVLEIIDEAQREDACPFIKIDQGAGQLEDDWLTHNSRCSACAGALISWFFDADRDFAGNWDYGDGVKALSAHLGLQSQFGYGDRDEHYRRSEAAALLTGIINDLDVDGAGDFGAATNWRGNTPFSVGDWPVPHLAVFRRLSEMYPDK